MFFVKRYGKGENTSFHVSFSIDKSNFLLNPRSEERCVPKGHISDRATQELKKIALPPQCGGGAISE